MNSASSSEALSDAAVLVTGGAGFIGTNFVLEWLRETDRLVINLDKLTYAGQRGNFAGATDDARHIFVEGDIGDTALVADLLARYRPAAIINFAAETHVDRSIRAPGAFIETNVAATQRLLDAARVYAGNLPAGAHKAFRFLHVSTDEVYGALGPDEAAFTEQTPCRPNSPYAASKAASDHLVRAYHHTYGLQVLTVNCSNNYGPYQFPEKFIPLMIHNALNGQPLPVYGDGRHIRDWLYVGDHCDALRRVLAAGSIGEVYNIGGCGEVKNIDAAHLLCDILDRKKARSDGRSYRAQIAFVADRPGHDRRYAVDSGKIQRALGWSPHETFTTGLEKTVQWYLDNREWVAGVTGGDSYRDWIAGHYNNGGRTT